MGAEAVTAALWEAIEAGRLMERTARVARFDRYQASRGIEAAADAVAGEAERAGLREVAVHRWSPAETRGWWTFAPPASWTPGSASLRLLAAGETVLSLRYPERPYSLAAYSAPTPPGGLRAPVVREQALAAGGAPEGRVVLLDGRGRIGAGTGRLLAARGAVALAGCPTLDSPDAPASASGRIELAPGSPLRAFSLSRADLARVRAAPDPLSAEVLVRAEQAGRMPLVTGVLPCDVAGDPGPADPGTRCAEVLLQAHLCHPAPGADDNAAGVAALVEVAAALARLRPPLRRTVRFLWAPEFVGTAAYLHDLVEHGPLPAPAAVVNLDLIGQPQHEGGPIVVDPAPDHVGGPTTAVLEHCLGLLPASRPSYSGADVLHDWAWTTVGCTGASDHVLYGDRRVAVPAAGLGHVPGPRHHTSADVAERIDPQEARRVAVAAAGAAALLAGLAPPDGRWLAGLVLRSGWRRLLRTAARVESEAGQPPGDPQQGGSAVDPRAPALRARLRDHLVAAVRTDLAAAASFAAAGPGAAPDGAVRRFRDAAGDLLGVTAPSPRTNRPPAAALQRCWPGPFNLRAALAAAAAAQREALEAWLDGEGAGAYTAMTALAQAVDGRSTEDEVLHRAAFTTGLAVPVEPARTFLEALRASGWVVEAPDA